MLSDRTLGLTTHMLTAKVMAALILSCGQCNVSNQTWYVLHVEEDAYHDNIFCFSVHISRELFEDSFEAKEPNSNWKERQRIIRNVGISLQP